MPPASGDPNPVFAGVLGLIPGVGAMYNGQYAKGAMHLIVFVVLVTMADNLNWVFYWLVWGWVFYQAFDAYHTARARRDGLPLPNPFGWNEIGDRLGFGRTSPSTSSPTPSSPHAAGFAQAASQEPMSGWTGYRPPLETAARRPTAYAETPRPVSENPYSAPYTSPIPPPVPPVVPPASPYMTNVPYVPTYTGGSSDPVAMSLPVTATRRFPVGAIWLIGLGTLFLLGNLFPAFRLHGQWLTPVLLVAVAAWSATRRWEQFRVASLTVGASPNLAGAMKGPAVLLTVALLLALQAGDLLSFRRSWPALLVVLGLLQLAQRASVAVIPGVQSLPGTDSAVPPVRSTSGTGSLGL